MNKHESTSSYGPLVGAIDEGTSSARFLVLQFYLLLVINLILYNPHDTCVNAFTSFGFLYQDVEPSYI